MSMFARFGEILVIVAVLLGVMPFLVSTVAPGGVATLKSFYDVLHVDWLSELAIGGIGLLFILIGISIARATHPRPRAIQNR
jgi:hypothetical protein